MMWGLFEPGEDPTFAPPFYSTIHCARSARNNPEFRNTTLVPYGHTETRQQIAKRVHKWRAAFSARQERT